MDTTSKERSNTYASRRPRSDDVALRLHVEALVDAAPPLAPEQVRRLRVLIRG